MVDFRANHVVFKRCRPSECGVMIDMMVLPEGSWSKVKRSFKSISKWQACWGKKHHHQPANSCKFRQLSAAKMPGLLRWSNSYGAWFGRPTPYYHKGCWSSTLNQFLRPFQFGFKKQPVTTITWCVLPRVSQCQGPPFFVFPFFPLAAVTSSCVSTWAGWWVEVGSSQKDFLKKSCGSVETPSLSNHKNLCLKF